jgi:hypothetical protein
MLRRCLVCERLHSALDGCANVITPHTPLISPVPNSTGIKLRED